MWISKPPSRPASSVGVTEPIIESSSCGSPTQEKIKNLQYYKDPIDKQEKVQISQNIDSVIYSDEFALEHNNKTPVEALFDIQRLSYQEAKFVRKNMLVEQLEIERTSPYKTIINKEQTTTDKVTDFLLMSDQQFENQSIGGLPYACFKRRAGRPRVRPEIYNPYNNQLRNNVPVQYLESSGYAMGSSPGDVLRRGVLSFMRSGGNSPAFEDIRHLLQEGQTTGDQIYEYMTKLVKQSITAYKKRHILTDTSYAQIVLTYSNSQQLLSQLNNPPYNTAVIDQLLKNYVNWQNTNELPSMQNPKKKYSKKRNGPSNKHNGVIYKQNTSAGIQIPARFRPPPQDTSMYIQPKNEDYISEDLRMQVPFECQKSSFVVLAGKQTQVRAPVRYNNSARGKNTQNSKDDDDDGFGQSSNSSYYAEEDEEDIFEPDIQ